MRRDIVAGMAKCMDGVDVGIHGFDDHSMPMRDRRVQPQVDSGQHGIAGGFMRTLGILLMTNGFFIAEREVDEAGRRGRGDRMSRANRRRRDSRRAHCRVAEAVHQTCTRLSGANHIGMECIEVHERRRCAIGVRNIDADEGLVQNRGWESAAGPCPGS